MQEHLQDAQQAQDHRDEQDAAPAPAPVTAAGGPRGRTLGIAALAGALAVGALAVGLAIGGGSGGATVDALAARQPTTVSQAGWTSPDGRTQVQPDGRGGPGLRGGFRFGAITITAIDGTKLSLTTDDGWTRTIDASGATVTKNGATVALSTLAVGDRIAFRETRNTDGSYTITAIIVVQPTVAGTVASISGSTVTVTTFGGGTSKVALSGSTTFTLDGKASTKDAVVAGARIEARGTLGSDGTLTASSVEIKPARVAGTVKEKSANALTLTVRDGSSVVVKVSSSTTYQVRGVTSPTLADVAVGAVVVASGTQNADGSLTATVVRAGGGDVGGPGMRGWGRGHGHGNRDWGFPGADPDASPAPSSGPSGTNG